VDAPPVNGVADYDLLQDLCDGVILIVRPDHTDRTLCVKAADAVPKSKLLGAVVNCVEEWFLWKSHEYYYGPVAPGDEL
jgi:Mrp family chromosome partitioning ATPase